MANVGLVDRMNFFAKVNLIYLLLMELYLVLMCRYLLYLIILFYNIYVITLVVILYRLLVSFVFGFTKKRKFSNCNF